MNVVAIDPGTSHIGFAYSDGVSMCVRTIEAPELYALNKLKKLVAETIEEIKFRPVDFIVFEDYGFGGTFFNAEVAELVGMLKLMISKEKIKAKIVFLAPNTVKKIVTGNGRATKAQVKKAVELVGVSSHESDAAALILVMQKYLSNQLDAETTRKIRGRTYNNV